MACQYIFMYLFQKKTKTKQTKRSVLELGYFINTCRPFRRQAFPVLRVEVLFYLLLLPRW